MNWIIFNVKSTRSYNTSAYVGGSGSNIDFVSELGRVITFKSICPYYDERNNKESPLSVFRKLSKEYKNKTGVLTSSSHIDLKGNYLCTDFEVVEDTGHNFTISWEFTEKIPFNTVKQTFRVWGSAAVSTPTKTQTKTAIKKTIVKKSGSNLSATTKKLFKSCGVINPSNKSRVCVKYLQKFLQTIGYYRRGRIDGVYAWYTAAEIKRLQKNRKLKRTGKWDKKTLTYFQKKYKYP